MDKETRFEQKVSLDSEAGSIVLARSDYSSEKVEKMIRRLEKKFEENGWSHTQVQKKVMTGKTLFSERWLCKNVDGSEFELSILQEKCKDTQISIETVSEQAINKSAITIEIYNWLKQAALI